jgi:hypothetical protein
MKATNELRWVERNVSTPHPKYTNITVEAVSRVLQQKWAQVHHQREPDAFIETEWRDVPLEKEPT